MGIFKKKKVKKEEEEATSSVQEVTNKPKPGIKIVEEEELPEPPKPPKPAKELEPEIPDEQDVYTMELTQDQLVRRIRQLEQSEDLALYIRVMQGKDDYEELQELMEVLPDESKK